MTTSATSSVAVRVQTGGCRPRRRDRPPAPPAFPLDRLPPICVKRHAPQLTHGRYPINKEIKRPNNIKCLLETKRLDDREGLERV